MAQQDLFRFGVIKECEPSLSQMSQQAPPTAKRKTLHLWLKWSLWLTIAWIVSLVVKDVPTIPSEGYVRWFFIELIFNGLAGILEFITSAIIAGVCTGIAVLAIDRNVDTLWGARTPLNRGAIYAIIIGVILGLLMMTAKLGQHST